MFAAVNCDIIDGIRDDIIEDAALLVNERGNIEKCAARENLSLPPEAQVIDMQEGIIIPGLIDTHIHLCFAPVSDPLGKLTDESEARTSTRALKHAAQTLKGGITTVRDVGGKNYVNIALKKAGSEDFFPLPRILTAGCSLTMTGGHGWPIAEEVDGRTELRQGARKQLKKGADLIKVMATGGILTKGVKPGAPQLSVEEMKAAVEVANKADCRVAAHAQGNKGIKNAVRAGVNSIEHGVYLDTEAVDMMIKNDVYLVPTLSAIHWIVEKGDDHEIPDYAVEKSKNLIEDHIESFEMAHEAGVKITMGTDAGSPFNEHGKNHYELILMVNQGMSAMQAIKSATSRAAELLDIDSRTGTLTGGKAADFVVLEKSPLEDIRNIKTVQKVFIQGEEQNLSW